MQLLISYWPTVIWSHHPLRFRRGPYTCPQRWHRRPAEGVETTSWSSSTDVASYRRAGPQTTASWAVDLWLARHKAYDRDLWRDIVETTTPLEGPAAWCWWWGV